HTVPTPPPSRYPATPRPRPHLPLPSFPTRRSSDLPPPRSRDRHGSQRLDVAAAGLPEQPVLRRELLRRRRGPSAGGGPIARQGRSEEHTSELQSRGHIVCRLLLEKKNPRVVG